VAESWARVMTVQALTGDDPAGSAIGADAW
jgi:hypothetical protein